ncbi:MAG: hypothetical protein M1132_05565 [Chloroflexi bacterium]|nr:hypothetical protein [Chloroflexota bacterium]
MKKTLVILVLLVALLLVVTATASAEGPTPNAHNCAGVVVNQFVGPGLPPMGYTITRHYAWTDFGVSDLFLQFAGQACQ